VLLPENEEPYSVVDRQERGERWMERKLRSGRFVSTLSAHAIPTFSHHKIRFGPKKKPHPLPLSLSRKKERKTNTAEPSIARKAQTQTPKNPSRLHPISIQF